VTAKFAIGLSVRHFFSVVISIFVKGFINRFKIYVFCKNVKKEFNFCGTYGSPMIPPFVLILFVKKDFSHFEFCLINYF